MIELDCAEWLSLWREHLAINADWSAISTMGVDENDLRIALGSDMPMALRLWIEDDRTD